MRWRKRATVSRRAEGRRYCRVAFPLLVLGSLILWTAEAEAQQSGRLFIETVAETSSSGTLRVQLASNSREFDGESEAYREKAVPMTGNSTIVRFDNVEPGRYAVTLYLDENGDGELNTNLFGVPKEPFGFSQNPRIGMSRPGFTETAFEYTGEELELTVELK